MFRRLAHTFRPGSRDAGMALPTVFGIGIVMLVMVAGSMSVSNAALQRTNHDEDQQAAVAATYAGVEEYQSRLANETDYHRYGNRDAPFTIQTSSSVVAPPRANPAFGVNATGTWASVPVGAGETPTSSFRYEVDNSDYISDGRLRVRVTGRSGQATHSVIADLRQSGFLDFMYLTIYEVSDPLISGRTNCEMYAHAGSRAANCDIRFAEQDVLNGPVHTNDRLYICGATFNSSVSTSDPNARIRGPGECGDGTYAIGTGPVYRAPQDMPPSNNDLRSETYTGIPSRVPNPGCLYTGPTVIEFQAGGWMVVRSPWTKFTQITSAGVGSNPSDNRCGRPADLQSSAGARIRTLPDNLIFVQGVPSSTSSDQNRRMATDPAVPANIECLSSTRSGGFQIRNTAIRFPLANEILDERDSDSGRPAYSCTNGDLYVSGQFGGRMTAAAANYIYITGDVTYQDENEDVLGLVGNNAIWIYNPIVRNGTTVGYARFEDRTITAALLAVQHTIQVQNYDGWYGETNTWTINRTTYTRDKVLSGRRELRITGTMAQKFRGPVGANVPTDPYGAITTTGFIKKYGYDERFKFNAPPKFLKPASTTYGVSQMMDVATAWDATGTAR